MAFSLDKPDTSDNRSEDTDKGIPLMGRPKKGGKKRCLWTSEGLTNVIQFAKKMNAFKMQS